MRKFGVAENEIAGLLQLTIECRDCKKLKEIIRGLKRGDCWCEMGIGNPMVSSHSPQCIAAQKAIEAG
jgi:hypothetical protein